MRSLVLIFVLGWTIVHAGTKVIQTTSTTTTATTSTTTTTTSTTTTTAAPTTTTSTGVVTTTTTTTTTSTLAPITPPADFMILPTPGGTQVALISSVTANLMRCVRFVATMDMGGLTRISSGFTSASGSATIAVALYPDSNSGAALASASGGTTTTADVISAGGFTPFSIVSGTTYRLCMCGSSVFAEGLVLGDSSAANGHIAGLLNMATTTVGHAGNSCTAGVPPSTTGAITADTSGIVPVAVVE